MTDMRIGYIGGHENYFFFSSRRRHTRWPRDWSSDVCSSDLAPVFGFTAGLIFLWSVFSRGAFFTRGLFTRGLAVVSRSASAAPFISAAGAIGFCNAGVALAFAPTRRGDLFHFKVDFSTVQIDTDHPHLQLIPEAEHFAGALAQEAMFGGLKPIVVFRQRGDMHQAIHVQIFQLHKQAKAGNTADHAIENRAHMVLQVFTLQPTDYIARGLIGTALGQRAVLAQGHHIGGAIGVELVFWKRFGAFNLDHLGRSLIAAYDRTDRSVHEQIRVTSNR